MWVTRSHHNKKGGEMEKKCMPVGGQGLRFTQREKERDTAARVGGGGAKEEEEGDTVV